MNVRSWKNYGSNVWFLQKTFISLYFEWFLFTFLYLKIFSFQLTKNEIIVKCPRVPKIFLVCPKVFNVSKNNDKILVMRKFYHFLFQIWIRNMLYRHAQMVVVATQIRCCIITWCNKLIVYLLLMLNLSQVSPKKHQLFFLFALCLSRRGT